MTRSAASSPSNLPRFPVAAMLAATCAAGLAVRAALSGALAKYAGVALYGTAMFWLVLLFSPRRPMLAAALSLALCWAIESAQLTPVPARLSAEHTIFRLTLGSTFSPWDLPAYAAGVALGLTCALALRRGRDLAPRA